jgi:hypothetical protein
MPKKSLASFFVSALAMLELLKTKAEGKGSTRSDAKAYKIVNKRRPKCVC